MVGGPGGHTDIWRAQRREAGRHGHPFLEGPGMWNGAETGGVRAPSPAFWGPCPVFPSFSALLLAVPGGRGLSRGHRLAGVGCGGWGHSAGWPSVTGLRGGGRSGQVAPALGAGECGAGGSGPESSGLGLGGGGCEGERGGAGPGLTGEDRLRACGGSPCKIALVLEALALHWLVCLHRARLVGRTSGGER